MSTLLESILRNVKITNEILGTAAAPPDASYTVKGITKILATAQQLQDAEDEDDATMDYAVSGRAIIDSNFATEQMIQAALDDYSPPDPDIPVLDVTQVNSGSWNEGDIIGAEVFLDNKFVGWGQGGELKYFGSLSDAIDGTPVYGTIKCYKNAEEDNLPFKTLTIDGNGFNLFHESPHEMFTGTTSGHTLTLMNFREIYIDQSVNPNAMFNPDGNNITINLINNLKISSPVRIVDADGTNCKINIVGSLIENRKWATTSQNWTNTSNMADFYTAGCELNIDRCIIQGWNSIGEINDNSSVRVTNSTIWNRYLYSTNWACTQKFINCTIKCQSSKLNAGIAYSHSTYTTKANAITITGCDVTSVGDKSLDYGATNESFFCCPNPLGKLIINSTTFKLTAPSGVTPYYLFKNSGNGIGKIGLNGVITSHDKDAGVTLSFGTLIVSADLI